jgi:hypothetical protein
MRRLSLIAVLSLLATPAFAGEECEGLSGFQCENMCPLAHAANARRAVGTEALAVACKARAEYAAQVVKNLDRI